MSVYCGSASAYYGEVFLTFFLPIPVLDKNLGKMAQNGMGSFSTGICDCAADCGGFFTAYCCPCLVMQELETKSGGVSFSAFSYVVDHIGCVVEKK